MFGHGLEENTLFSQPQETVRKRCSVQQTPKKSPNLSNLVLKEDLQLHLGKLIFWGKVFMTF